MPVAPSPLVQFVLAQTRRGPCHCGRCFDGGSGPEPHHSHTVDMVFFQVAPAGDLTPALRAEFIRLSRSHVTALATLDVFDRREHGYQELGTWLGDQEVALRYMALGAMLRVFDLLSPYTVLGLSKDDPLALQVAGRGYVSVKNIPQLHV